VKAEKPSPFAKERLALLRKARKQQKLVEEYLPSAIDLLSK